MAHSFYLLQFSDVPSKRPTTALLNFSPAPHSIASCLAFPQHLQPAGAWRTCVYSGVLLGSGGAPPGQGFIRSPACLHCMAGGWMGGGRMVGGWWAVGRVSGPAATT